MAVRLSAPPARRPLPPGKIPGTHFCQRLSQPQGHSAAGRIRSSEKSNDLIGIRTRNLPACSVVPRPTTLPRAHPPQPEKMVVASGNTESKKLEKNLKYCMTEPLAQVVSRRKYPRCTKVNQRTSGAVMHLIIHYIIPEIGKL
jgi:hypothetical protein